MTSSLTYAAFLGNHPSLSIAELASALPDFKVIRRVGNTIVLFTCSAELSAKDLNVWGGIFLLAKQVSVNSPSFDRVPATLLDEVKNVKGKVTFSIRTFGVDRDVTHRLYRDCKNILKKNNIPARYIGNETKPPVSAQLRDTGIADGKHGCEIVLFGNDEGELFWVGRTIAAQDPDAYTKRDMQKPIRDTRVGLLPPKLAQIMINLGNWAARQANPGLKKSIVVYDPFCGTGVIPMEALLRKWPVLGSDASLKAANGCEKNLDWIRKEYDIKKKDVPSVHWKQDATKDFELKKGGKDPYPDVIVTETTLGPPLTDRPTTKDVAKFRSECDALEIAFLTNAAKNLPGVPVVAMFPVWYVKAGPVHLEKVWKALPDLGLRAVLPPGAASDTPDRTSIVYRRTDQFVGREIVILLPVKKK